MHLITLDHKPATVQQLHINEGWTFDNENLAADATFNYLPRLFIAAATKADCIEAYWNLLGVAWIQKKIMSDVKRSNNART